MTESTSKTKFFTSYYAGVSWDRTEAQSLPEAKRDSARKCPCAGQTHMWVGVMTPVGLVKKVAVNRYDQITQRHSGWVDL